MKARFETTEEEDDKARTLIEERFCKAYNAGARHDFHAVPHTDELWESLLKIIGIGEWEDDVSASDPLLGD